MSPQYARPYGATNVALSSRNPRRSAEFYAAVLDSYDVGHEDGWVQIQAPGARDSAIFHGATESGLGGSAWFGFRLASPERISAAVEVVGATGGQVVEHGELIAGQPYLFARDPDGYMFEIWYEGSDSHE